MTENTVESTTEVASSDAVSNQQVTQNQSASDNVQSSQSAESEKMVPQSVVDKVVGSTRKEAYEKAYQKAQAEIMQQYGINSDNSQPSVGDDSQSFDINQFKQQVTQQIYQKFEENQRQHRAREIASEYQNKMQHEFYQDPEFMSAYQESGIEQHPQLVLMANEMPNTAAVIKDMVNNPLKFANVMALANINPSAAKKEIAKLSKSLQVNEDAKNQPRSTPPLSQAKSSTHGIGGVADGSSPSVSDLRKRFV